MTENVLAMTAVGSTIEFYSMWGEHFSGTVAARGRDSLCAAVFRDSEASEPIGEPNLILLPHLGPLLVERVNVNF
jgi:hypothetical protein